MYFYSTYYVRFKFQVILLPITLQTYIYYQFYYSDTDIRPAEEQMVNKKLISAMRGRIKIT